MTPLKKYSVLLAALFLTLPAADVVLSEAEAADMPNVATGWLDESYPYLAVDQALSDALSELGHNLDVAIDVSPKIEGRVRHYNHDGTAGEFLDYLVAEHRLDWVVDHGRLFITSADERSTRSWAGDVGAFEKVKDALTEAGIDDPRFPVGFDSGRGEFNLSAPPKYVTLAAPVIDRALAPKRTRTVNVIHGRPRKGGT